MKWAGSIGAFLAALAAALGAALWNGYPLVFYDSGDYIAQSHTFVPLIYRTFPYSLILTFSHGGLSLWGPAVLQAAVTAWTIREFVAAFGPERGRNRILLLAALLLAFGSAMPWVAGQLMPDAFCAPQVLALTILMVERGRLSAIRRGGLAVIAALGAFSHLSQMALALGLIGLGALLWWPLRRKPVLRPRLLAAGLATFLALITIPGVNYLLTGRVFFSESGPVFLVARLAQDGLLQAHLDKTCTDSPTILCGFRSQIPNTANDLLWKRDSVLVELGGWYAFRPIATEVIAASLKRDPIGHLQAAFRNFGQQVIRAKTGEGLFNQWETTKDMVHRYFPDEARAYDQSRQQREELHFTELNHLHLSLALGALVLLPGIAIWQWRRGQYRGAMASFYVVAAVFGNAAICGILSNPTDRYQARVAWTPILCLLVALASPSGNRDRLRV